MKFPGWTVSNAWISNGNSAFLPSVVSGVSRIVWIAVLCLGLSACAGTGISAHQPGAAAPEEAVPSDNDLRIAGLLVGTLAQLVGFEPLAFTVQVTTPGTGLGHALQRELRRHGYGIQKVEQDHGRNYLSYARTEIVSNSGFIVEYSLQIRDVRISRQFASSGSRITPLSPTVVAGVEPQPVRMRADSFAAAQGEAQAAGVLFELEDGQQVSYAGSARANQSAPASGQVSDGQGTLLNQRRRLNVGSLLELNSVDSIDLGDYIAVRQFEIQFPSSDSSILGEENKTRIHRALGGFTAERDLITLASCAGQESPAATTDSDRSLQYQGRIRRELLSAGVGKSSIRITACSGLDRQKSERPRSVILTLRRLKNAG